MARGIGTCLVTGDNSVTLLGRDRKEAAELSAHLQGRVEIALLVLSGTLDVSGGVPL
jgi:hypothetical protein